MFEWDNAKAHSNLASHGVSFNEAQTVFDDPFFLIYEDPEHSVGETRHIMIGESPYGRLLVVVYTERPTGTRLISAREATRFERKHYEEAD